MRERRYAPLGTVSDHTSRIEALEGGLSSADRTSLENVYIGICLDSPAVTVASNGTTITLSLENSGGGDLRFYTTDGEIVTLDCTPAATVALTPGSDTVAVENFVYVLESTGALTAATAWPTGVRYSPVATVLCQSAASAQTNGLRKVHAWTDHSASTTTGHLGDLNYWVRQQPATWQSGVSLTGTYGDGVFDVATTVGSILQLHPHAYPAYDTSGTDDANIVNDSVTPYLLVNDFSGITLDAAGVTVVNKYMNIVIWGVVSEDTVDCHLMANLPVGSYTNEANAITDVDGTAVYDIPSEYTGVGFLIARLTVRLQGTTWSESQKTDLRGLFPSTGAGGSGGGGSVAVKNSIELDAGELQLVGDEASPGNTYYYGTNGSGVKGWNVLPSGGAEVVAGDVNSEASTDGWVLTSDGAGNAAWEAVPAGGTEVNDLTSAVTWANIPIANVPTGVTGAEVALGNHTHVIANITDFTDNSTNWNTAFTWGDHSTAGYISSASATQLSFSITGTLSTGQTSGLEIEDHSGTSHDVGFNLLPRSSDNNSNITLAAQHCGLLWDKTSSTARTVTLEANTSTDFPVGGIITLMNSFTSGNVTISEGSGTTLYYMDPTIGRVDTLGTATLAPGGVATIRRAGTATYYIFGSGITG